MTKKDVVQRFFDHFLCLSNYFFDVSSPKNKNLLIMKNVKRIFLLIALIVLANKVLFSDFELPKAESKAITIATIK